MRDDKAGQRPPLRAAALIVIALVWTGMLLGVSFLATPVKFWAPSLTLPVALDVGRQTFHMFSRIELVFAFALVPLACLARPRGGLCGIALVLLALVAMQSAWLLPQLDARTEMILAGNTPPPSSLHEVYIAIDLAKLGLLAALAWLQWRQWPEAGRSASRSARRGPDSAQRASRH